MTTRLGSKDEIDKKLTISSPITRRRIMLFSALVCLGLISGQSLADSLVYSHLASLNNATPLVHLSYWERRPDGDLKEIQERLRTMTLNSLERAGISAEDTGRKSFSIDLRIVTDSDQALVGVTSFSYLLEEVWLQRDPEQSVPGGGALTWWKKSFSPTNSKILEETLVEIVEIAVEDFVEARQVAQEMAGVKSAAPARSCKK